MSENFSRTSSTDNRSKDLASTDSKTQETSLKEGAYLASGILILVMGIVGALMYSEGETLRVESEIPAAADQLVQAFPTPAMAFQSTSPTPSSNPTPLDTSTTQPNSQSEVEPQGEDFENQTVHFEFDQATLSDAAKASLEPHAHQLNTYQNLSILVRGHTDQKGSKPYNEALSLRRAKAVKEYLVSLGLSAESIQIEGLGKTKPVCTVTTDACEAQNRRAKVIFTKMELPNDNSEPLISKTITEPEQDPVDSAEGPREVKGSNPHTTIETVQLSESAEQIVPADTIASATTSQ